MIIQADRWQDIDPATWPAKHFPPKEFACRGTGKVLADVDFLIWLERVRLAAKFPMPLNRGYSTPEHNAAVGGSKNSFHMKGKAVDVDIWGPVALKLVKIASAHDVKGLGVYQSLEWPEENRWLHLDMGDRVAIWSNP